MFNYAGRGAQVGVHSRTSLRRLRPRLWWALLAWVWLLSGCGSVDPVVKIGLAAPFEGRHREIGYDVIYSARMAVREINAAGGIGGYRVSLVAVDDGGDPETAAAVAASLVIDPAVVVVVGHWLPESNAAAAPLYESSGMAFIRGGEGRFQPSAAADLPAEFRQRYQEITPFDEEAGPLAGPAYDAFQLIWEAMATASADEGAVNRSTMRTALWALNAGSGE